MREVVEGEGDGAGEVVEGDVEAGEASQLGETRGEVAGKLILLQIEIAEGLELGEVRGEWAGEEVGAEAEDTELREAGEGVGRNLADEADAGEAEREDGGVGGVAGDTDPGASGEVGVPLEAALVRDLGEKGQQRLLVLSRLGGHAEWTQQQCYEQNGRHYSIWFHSQLHNAARSYGHQKQKRI